MTTITKSHLEQREFSQEAKNTQDTSNLIRLVVI